MNTKQYSFATVGAGSGHCQKGVVIIMVTIALLAILAMAGLTMDMGRTYLNKTRLQNALDAAALSGAKTVNSGANVSDAASDALIAFNYHLEGDLLDANLIPTIEFSATLSPSFTAGAIGGNARYIRVRITDLPVPTGLTRVLPGVGDNLSIGGSAVAGPIPLGDADSGETCLLAPIMFCGDPDPDADTDCSDGSCYGYDDTSNIILKSPDWNSNDPDYTIGPGNFQLVDFGSGGADVREILAGGLDACLPNDMPIITTEPGNTVGPVAQGFNTRFGHYLGGMRMEDFPPDVVVTENISYVEYQEQVANGNWDYAPLEEGGSGVRGRRILAVPMADCTGSNTGRTDLPLLDIVCFFLTQKVDKPPGGEIYGELIGECPVDGDVAENPGPVPGPGTGASLRLFKIVLYKDPDNVDS